MEVEEAMLQEQMSLKGIVVSEKGIGYILFLAARYF